MTTPTAVGPSRPVATPAGDVNSIHVIGAPGSYYLTADPFGAPGRNGIYVDPDDVVLDLSGCSVIGVTGRSRAS